MTNTNQAQLDRIATIKTLSGIRAENKATWSYYLDGMYTADELKLALDALAARAGILNAPRSLFA